MTAYRQRDLAGPVAAALADVPVVVLTGLRQAGKTTFLRSEPALAGRRYITLDDFAALEGARREPEALVGGDEPLTIDEAQRAPELLLAIKRSVDRKRVAGRFLLSGSAHFQMAAGVSESLAGRAVSFCMHPFSRREVLGRKRPRPFVRSFFDSSRLVRVVGEPPLRDSEILRGGLPPVALGDVADPSLWFRGYEQTYLERDVRALAQVADLVPFRLVLKLAALRTGQILKISELARDAKLPVTTATRYLGLLEASFVVDRLEPFLGNRSTRLIKSPKVMVGDAGLAAHLAGVTDVGPGADEPMRGALLETYVAHNLAAILGAGWPGAKLGFWHVQGRHEVDFVIEAGRDCLAIEVKGGTRWAEADLGGLRAFLNATPRCRAALLAYGGEEAVKIGERLFAVPLGWVLS